VTGPAAVNADTSAGNQQTVLLLTALIIVAVILLLVYRSPVLWLLPLAGAVAAIIVAQASAHGLANAGLTVSTLSSDIVIVLVFGAASDYVLLLVHRYREELRHRAATEAAMAVTPGKIDIDALRAQQAIVETAALEAGRDPKSIDVLVRVNVAKGAAPQAVVDDTRRVAGTVGFGHFFIEQMYTDDTVDQAIASRPSRPSIVLIDDARHHLQPARGTR
jgi:MMPL family